MRNIHILLALALAAPGIAPPPAKERLVSDERLREAEAILQTEANLPGSFPPDAIQASVAVLAYGRCERALDDGPLYGADGDGVVHEARTPKEAVDLLPLCGGVLLRSAPYREVLHAGEASPDLLRAALAWEEAESGSEDLGNAIADAAGFPRPDWSRTLGLQVVVDGGRVHVSAVTGEVAVAL